MAGPPPRLDGIVIACGTGSTVADDGGQDRHGSREEVAEERKTAMSLDVYLEIERDEPTDAERAYNLLLANGFDDFASDFWSRHSDEIGKIRFYWANITHNLNKMADAAGGRVRGRGP